MMLKDQIQNKLGLKHSLGISKEDVEELKDQIQNKLGLKLIKCQTKERT
mgnify:CR=1 FL=1